MDRREFVGLVLSTVLVPALGSGEPSLPVEYQYKGWSIQFSKHLDFSPIGSCVQGYATDGKVHGKILFDRNKSLVDITKQFESWLDRLEKRTV